MEANDRKFRHITLILYLPFLSSARKGEEDVDKETGKTINKEFKIKDYGRLQRKAHHRAKGIKGEAD